MRQYGDYELGLKCPVKQNYVIKSMRKYKTFLLSYVRNFPEEVCKIQSTDIHLKLNVPP